MKTGIDSTIPDYSAGTANVNYFSEVTGETGSIRIRPGTTDEDIVNQYSNQFPKESRMFLQFVGELNSQLDRDNGMSQGGTLMSLVKIPEPVMHAMRFLRGEDFWSEKKNIYSFIRKYPKFAVGQHGSQKKGIIIK